MKKVDKAFLIGAMLLIVGTLWAFTMNSIGTIEWMLLLSGIVLGLLAGMVQGWAIALNKRGKIGKGKKILWVVGTIIVLIALKISINISIPSILATSESGIWLSIIFAVGGLLLGRTFYSRLGDSKLKLS